LRVASAFFGFAKKRKKEGGDQILSYKWVDIKSGQKEPLTAQQITIGLTISWPEKAVGKGKERTVGPFTATFDALA